MSTMDWSGSVRLRSGNNRQVMTRWQVAKVIGLHFIAVGLQEPTSAVMGNAYTRLMAAEVPDYEGFCFAIDGCNRFSLGVVPLRSVDTVGATYCGDTSVWSMLDAIQVDHVLALLDTGEQRCC